MNIGNSEIGEQKTIMHYLMLKLDDPSLADRVATVAEKLFYSMCQETDYVKNVKVLINYIQRKDNADVLIIMQLEGETALEKYLSHSAHMEFVKVVDPHLIRKTSFDWCK